MNPTEEQEELDFLRWFYHRQRIASGNSKAFECAVANIYEHETRGEFPYFLPKNCAT